MNKKLAFYCWLLAPVALFAFHYGPGQADLARDEAARQIAIGQALEQKEDWHGAMDAYTGALTKLPPEDKTARWQLRLAQSKVRMYSGELPEAIGDMDGLLTEMEKEGAPAKQVDGVRSNLGTAEYYAGWLMRLEGASTEEWSVEVDSARQHFRLLAEDKLNTGSTEAKGYQENLEATVRLARMDLSELQGLPLPKFCQGCKNVSQKCRSQCEGKCKKPAEKKKDARGAGTDERPRGGS
jgi:hypothetical protein